MGIMATAYIALFTGLSSMPILAKIIIVILSAILGAPWATIAGGLRAYLSIDEVPVTLIMNYIAYYILNYLVRGPWKGKETYGYIRTDLLPQDVWFINLPTITIPGVGEVSINTTAESILLLIIIFIGLWYLLRNTTIGLRIRILGSNPDVLRAAGINVPLTIVLALTISGAIMGIVGAIVLARGDLDYRIPYPYEARTANYGYTDILVAWLSMLDIRAFPVAAYIVSSLYITGLKLQVAGLGEAATTFVFMGTVLLTYTVIRVFSEYTIRIVRTLSLKR